MPASAPSGVEAGAGPGAATRGGVGLVLAEPEEQSLLSAYWELDDRDKRGAFRFLSYRPNYVLPLHYTSGINRTPTSPSVNRNGNLPEYRPIETKLQISLRTKVVQGLLLPNADLWFAFTQQSLWQVWNKQQSSPFRSTDYEPEAIYVLSVPKNLRQLPFSWQFRMVQAGIAHQSNGQTIPLSRSWNRVYAGAGFEKGDIALTARVLKRLTEDADRDDNPDITFYRGRGDITLAWTPGSATASLLWRTNFRNASRGAWQFDWTFPVDSSKPLGLRWYAQVFSGYGETLLDYNFKQTSVGAGLSLFEF
jgi:phospholipase A1